MGEGAVRSCEGLRFIRKATRVFTSFRIGKEGEREEGEGAGEGG